MIPDDKKAEILRAHRIREEHSVKRVAARLELQESAVRKVVSRYRAWLKAQNVTISDAVKN